MSKYLAAGGGTSDEGYKGFRDRAAHDRAHELWALPSWHPDAPTPSMRHMLRAALSRCLRIEGYCDYATNLDENDGPATQSER